jgi:hypothetical protein
MIDKLKKDGEGEFPYTDEKGVSYRSKKEYLQFEVLHFCGCGDPDSVMVYVKEFLQKLDNQEWGDYEDIPYMFLVYWADHNGFSEHGTTARCSWLSEKGKELLADIEWCLENEKDEE